MSEWLVVIVWSAGSIAGGISLYRKVRFFSTVWGIITMGFTGVLSGAAHSLLNAMFSINEPFFFLIGILGIGMTPILFAQWAFTGLSHLYLRWDRR